VSVFELWTLVFTAVTTAVNVIALGFVGVQIRYAARQTKRAAQDQEAEHLRQRRRDTVEAVRATTQYRERLKAPLPWNDRDGIQVKKFLDEAEGDPAKLVSIRAYLDYLEMLAVGVNEGVFDLPTLSRSSGGRILAVADNYTEYIERRRKELGSATLYAELEQLAASIREYRSRGAQAETDGSLNTRHAVPKPLVLKSSQQVQQE
jgi:hypothetical protein